MNHHLTKLLQIVDNFLYLKPIHSGSAVSHFKYGPLGELLRQNIHQEWTISNLITRNCNVYPFCSIDDGTDLLAGSSKN